VRESAVGEEQVLVIPTALLDEFGRFQGLSSDVDPFLSLVFDHANWCFMPRSVAETDETHKQLIPYALLRYGDSTLTYRRSPAAGENRLAGDLSVGIGGHISTKDPTLFGDHPLYAGMQREVAEEVDIGGDYSVRVVALLNDDTNAVGKVHLGVIAVFSLVRPEVRKHDPGISECRFLTTSALRRRRDEFENWSQICIDQMDSLAWIPDIDEKR
jgi:predicted NUDIX family phosphoesterase